MNYLLFKLVWFVKNEFQLQDLTEINVPKMVKICCAMYLSIFNRQSKDNIIIRNLHVR